MAMRVIGVYPVEFSERALRRFVQSLLPPSADSKMVKSKCDAYRDAMRSNMDGLYLIEAVVDVEEGEFDFGRVSQGDSITTESQVPYDEKFLSEDGEQASDPPNSGAARVAFFLHFLDPARPLQTADGPVTLPASSALPARLERLMPYELP